MIENETRRDQIVALRFLYHDVERVVDAVVFKQHREHAVVCGYEVLRDGEFSGQVKRYRLGELRDVELLDPDGVLDLRDGPRP